MATAFLVCGSLTGCTNDSPHKAVASGPSGDRMTASVTPGANRCPNVTDSVEATTGVLRAGPFSSDALRDPAGSDERKIWVASIRSGHDDARLTVTDPTGAKVSQVRRSGEALSETAQQFYPGAIRLSITGTYRIDITVGADRMCIVVDYVVS